MTVKSFWQPLLLVRCFLHEQSDSTDTVYAGQRSPLGRVAEEFPPLPVFCSGIYIYVF